MALNLAKTFTFAANTTIASAEVNTDFDTIYNAFSGLEAKTSTLAALKMDADPASALEVATKQYVDHYSAYKRPRLTFQTVALIDVENNTGTLNQTVIPFPDGSQISVTEDTAVTTKYRRFDITATANYISGTEDSGLYTGLTETANTWYAIYAVKSQINTANFVLVGTTTLPTQANVSTLNTNLGANSWVYLGLIKNGDESGATTDIVNFVQEGNITCFKNTCSGNAAANSQGLLYASTASGTSVTWSYASGTGSKQLPGNVLLVQYIGTRNAPGVARTFAIKDSAVAVQFFSSGVNDGAYTFMTSFVPASLGNVTSSGTTAVAIDLLVTGFVDLTLGVGSNPLI